MNGPQGNTLCFYEESGKENGANVLRFNFVRILCFLSFSVPFFFSIRTIFIIRFYFYCFVIVVVDSFPKKCYVFLMGSFRFWLKLSGEQKIGITSWNKFIKCDSIFLVCWPYNFVYWNFYFYYFHSRSV